MKKILYILIAILLLASTGAPLKTKTQTLGTGSLLEGFSGSDGSSATLLTRENNGMKLLEVETSTGNFGSEIMNNTPITGMVTKACGKYIHVWIDYSGQIEYYRFDTDITISPCSEKSYIPVITK
jgi:hypothetical protein